MSLQRLAFTASRRAATATIAKRAFTTTFVRRDAPTPPRKVNETKVQKLSDIHTIDDLVGPGAPPGTVPTDLEQSTGLERLEILGKMEGIDVFDMRPLDASRRGTLDNPIMVRSGGDEQYAGCTGSPADSHGVIWLTMTRKRPVERCPECGSVYKMEYIGTQDDGHGHDHAHEDHGYGGGHGHHGYEEPKTFADYVKPQYW